jgi:hypothetical protein
LDNPPGTDRWTHLYRGRRHVIACATVIEEMMPYLPSDVTYEILDFGLHLRPGGLRTVLQERIDEASPACDVILLGYGLCSMAVVGLHATSTALVIPRVDDCIAIFLGSRDAYQAQARTEPGTYYLTKGWIEVGDSPFEEHKRLIEKYGQSKADRMIQLTFKNYKRVCFINTGHSDLQRYHDYAREMAGRSDLRYEEVDGSPAIVKKMIDGPWDSDYVVVSPGETLRYEAFTNHSNQA